jgi:hypothetical protein
VREFLQERYQQVQDDSSVKERDRLKLSTVWYRVRPRLRKAGLLDENDAKKNLKDVRRMVEYQYIKQVCGEMGVTRAELGIYTAARPQVYYRGGIEDISFDNLDALAKKGVDVIAVEKEGAAEDFATFTAMTAQSIVNSRGFFTEYTEELAEKIKDKLGGKHFAIFRDFDSSGLAIDKKAGIVSLGVDFELLEELGIEVADVEEEYDGLEGGHWKWLNENLAPDDPDRKHLEYLKTKRIEIDSVEAAVGAEKVWKALRARLLKAFPTRDYNRAIKTDDVIRRYVYPTIMQDFTAMAVKMIARVTADYDKQVCKRLSKVKGFIEDVDEEERKIAIKQLTECEGDETMNELRDRLREITEWMEEVVGGEEEEDDDEDTR